MMKQFPLIRVKYSNEHIMALLFFVLVLYQIPAWVSRPVYIINYIAVLAGGLFIDLICNILRYKRPLCSVSAAVTVGIIKALYPDLPNLGSMIGVVAALVLGKHLFGGTGKNILNPAMAGVLILNVLFPGSLAFFTYTPMIIPAFVLSIPFMLIRPYASAGFILGVLIGLASNQMLNISYLISFGILFWGCVVITDPVTVTYRPFIGLFGGLACGLSSLVLMNHNFNYLMPAIILALNLASRFLDHFIPVKPKSRYSGERLGKKVKLFNKGVEDLRDFTHETRINQVKNETENFESAEVLKRIKDCEVFGLGGAAYPVYEKLMAVINSGANEKSFIINAVECDPGLIHDHWILEHYFDEISRGAKWICAAVGIDRTVIASKEKLLYKLPDKLSHKKVLDFYPSGAEKVLIKNVLGIALSYNEIPAKRGILVLNLQTVLAVYEAVAFNKRLCSKYITAANLSRNESLVIKASLGTRVLEITDTLYPGEGPVFKGGGLMQSSRVFDEDVIDRNTNFIAISAFPRYKESLLCSKCGICAENCPSGLEVFKIADLVDKGEFEKALKYEPQRCILCGTCSFYCLAGRNLTLRVKEAKSHIAVS